MRVCTAELTPTHTKTGWDKPRPQSIKKLLDKPIWYAWMDLLIDVAVSLRIALRRQQYYGDPERQRILSTTFGLTLLRPPSPVRPRRNATG